MIVKNEAAVLRRCFDSVRGLIDTWVIGDTGSTDGTPELVQELLADTPGRLYTTTWRDFGTNRSELLERARGTADYLLLLDADMTLTRCGPLPPLTADAYLLEHEGELSYSVPRLVRGCLPWRYVGATHEYLTCDWPFEPRRIQALRVAHHGDGGSRDDKLPRDLDLLSRQLAATPDDPRTLFYLAQTCRDLGDRERALSLYGARAQLGGFEEEAFYAAFQHAALASELDWPRGRELLADVWERRPSRIEPLYEIAVRARMSGEAAIADWATEIGVGHPLPDDILFVHRFVYEWGMRLERSLVLADQGNLGAAAALTEELLGQEGLPERARCTLLSNKAWLEHRGSQAVLRRGPSEPVRLAQLCGDVDVSTLHLAGEGHEGHLPGEGREGHLPGEGREGHLPGEGREGHLPGEGRDGERVTPSIAGDGTRFSLAVSSSEGASAGADATTSHCLGDSGHAVVTLLALGDDLQPTSRFVEAERGLLRPPGLAGVELTDVRLFSWRAGWWAVATTRSEGAPGRRGQALVSLDGGAIDVVRVLDCPDSGQQPRTWAPFPLGDELFLADGFRPFRVHVLDEARACLVELASIATDCRFAGLRAASPGLPIDDGYLFVASQDLFVGRRPSVLHRFVAVDGSLVPSGISRPFSFLGGELERCAGIAARGDQVVLSVGVGSSRVVLVVVPLESVISAIEPVRSTS